MMKLLVVGIICVMSFMQYTDHSYIGIQYVHGFIQSSSSLLSSSSSSSSLSFITTKKATTKIKNNHDHHSTSRRSNNNISFLNTKSKRSTFPSSSSMSTSSLSSSSSSKDNIPIPTATTTLQSISTSTTEPNIMIDTSSVQESKHDEYLNNDDLESKTRRSLGSQELLMLPRQYNVNPNIIFPSMNHICCILLSSTPKRNIVINAIEYIMNIHPLLNSYINGNGEPNKRIDLFQMVRSNDNNYEEQYPLQFVLQNNNNAVFNANDIVKPYVYTNNEEELESSWKETFQKDLDNGTIWLSSEQQQTKQPLWKLQIHTTKTSGQEDDEQSLSSPCVMFLTFNHAISDQGSVNKLIDQILYTIVALEEGKILPLDNNNSNNTIQSNDITVSLEESVLGIKQSWKDIKTQGITYHTIQYVIGKALEGLKDPVILPDKNNNDNDNNKNSLVTSLSIIAGRKAGGIDRNQQQRQTTLQFRTLSKQPTISLLNKCHVNQVTISNALTTAMTLTATDYISGGNNSGNNNKKRYYKVLQSLDMRRYGAQLDKGNTIACMAGSHDIMYGPLDDRSGEKIRHNMNNNKELTQQQFWELSKDAKEQTLSFINNSIGPIEAVRVFDFAMTISDLNNLVYVTSKSDSTKGRAYSVGVTNLGVYEKTKQFPLHPILNTNTNNQGNIIQKESSLLLQNKHGRYLINGIYYATSHTQSGCLFPVSAMTINDQLYFTFNPVQPIVSNDMNHQFANSFIDLLETVAETCDITKSSSNKEMKTEHKNNNFLSQLPNNLLTKVVSIIGLGSVLSHSNAWIQFYQSIMEMKANVVVPEDFNAALNFWIFFAVGHPILTPILWISDVLHGSPGPLIANLIPVSFLLGNLVFIAAITLSKEIRNAVNIAALAAFLSYVGAGLDGTAGLGDYNLALDDKYNGQIVKGCPAYEDVRQPSMNNFDLKKYQGLWYEHKFHDWTQFKEVYDTTLDIKLTEDGLGWIDDFAVKGPAPDSAPLSWDKSPVANGAHYFLFGRVDPNDPPGILREKGFGVEFPNYIVDVLKDPKTGEYTEAIQFQCLERGGVRVFEGINFMSRNPVMTNVELDAMHQRAKVAGMYPYGASPDQMHQVARRPIDAPAIDNNWQALWRTLGVDKLLQLLTEAIEDGGR